MILVESWSRHRQSFTRSSSHYPLGTLTVVWQECSVDAPELQGRWAGTTSSLSIKCDFAVYSCRRLGATVVAANSNSIILATGKCSLSEAVGYAKGLKRT